MPCKPGDASLWSYSATTLTLLLYPNAAITLHLRLPRMKCRTRPGGSGMVLAGSRGITSSMLCTCSSTAVATQHQGSWQRRSYDA